MSSYAAFISYSHADQAVARWLHRRLETYRIPSALVGKPSPFGPVTRRLLPVFRDRDELPASGDLGEELRAALGRSRFQIVLCSRKAATSRWVNEEILTFKRLHGEARTLALITDGEPFSGDDDECFPPALRYHLGPDGLLSEVPAEPIAADLRRGKDGRRLSVLKLIAGLTGLPLDALVRRDAVRHQRALMLLTTLSILVAAITLGMANYANDQRRIADQQRLAADNTLKFLVDTFAVANPATQNPRTITVLSVLATVSRRARTELGSEPAVSARLLRMTGDIFYNLGLGRESERDLTASLQREPAKSEGRATTLLKLSALDYKRGDAKTSAIRIDQAEQGFDGKAPYAKLVRAEIAERRGMVEYLNGNYAASAKMLGQSATLFGKTRRDRRDDLGRVWMNEARALLQIGRNAEATVLLAAAENAYAQKYGYEHVLTANAIQNRALAEFDGGDFARAEAMNVRALSVYGHVLDPDHPTIAAALILTGRIRMARNDPAGAISALDQARRIYVHLYGVRNAAVGDVDYYAAEAQATAGDYDAALDRIARAKVVYDANYGADDPDQVELLVLRARVLNAGARLGEANRDCAAAVRLKMRIGGDPASIADIRRMCAAIGQKPLRFTSDGND